MANKSVRTENGIVVGNVTQKGNSTNPVARYLYARFNRRISSILRQISPYKITEIGCGEGEVIRLALEQTQAQIIGTDISQAVLEEARIKTPACERVRFEKLSAEDIPITEEYTADCVICCEVLEHLECPTAGLDKIHALTNKHCLLSVPREPLWRGLNILRGAYIGQLGNTPGHIQHWTKSQFVAFVAKRFKIIATYSPLPWTIVLCEKK